MFKRIDHVEITTASLEKTLAFYTNIMGFQIKSRKKTDKLPMEEIIFLALGDTMMEIIAVKEAAPVSTIWQVGYRMMALEVADMDQAVAYLKGKGVELSKPPSITGTSKRAEIKDPNGISIELRQW